MSASNRWIVEPSVASRTGSANAPLRIINPSTPTEKSPLMALTPECSPDNDCTKMPVSIDASSASADTVPGTMRSATAPTPGVLRTPRTADALRPWPWASLLDFYDESIYPWPKAPEEMAVPLPIRMGFQKQYWTRPPPAKFANLELIKIPNFLHLTPATIRKHCQAIGGKLENLHKW